MSERPLWRWWLFCLALWVDKHSTCLWPADLWSWCVLPEWFATPDEIVASREGRWPKSWDDDFDEARHG